MTTQPKDSLGDRMKTYEQVSRTRLVRRTPVIVRVDGKAFHTLTRGMAKPYDFNFIGCMWDTAQRLCAEVQGAQMAYVQSDEISLLLVDYQTHETQAWFDNQVQKMVSISAAIATSEFTRAFSQNWPDRFAAGHRPLFDARVFNLPKEEVTNYFVWRQQDATRNSIQMLGQAHFSQKELHGVSCEGIQEKLFKEHGIDWNEHESYFKRGACVVKASSVLPTPDPDSYRSWVVDNEIPVFTHNREYVDRFVIGVEKAVERDEDPFAAPVDPKDERVAELEDTLLEVRQRLVEMGEPPKPDSPFCTCRSLRLLVKFRHLPNCPVCLKPKEPS